MKPVEGDAVDRLLEAWREEAAAEAKGCGVTVADLTAGIVPVQRDASVAVKFCAGHTRVAGLSPIKPQPRPDAVPGFHAASSALPPPPGQAAGNRLVVHRNVNAVVGLVPAGWATFAGVGMNVKLGATDGEFLRYTR